MPRLLVRDRLTWLTYAQIAAWGYFLYGFSPVVPLLRDEQHTSRTVASLHGTAFAVGNVLSGLLLPPLTRRIGRAGVIWGGLAGVAAAAVGLLLSHPLAATLTCAVLGSISGGLVVNGVTTVLADHHRSGGAAAISEANAAAAAVGVVAPLVVGAAVAAGLGWRPGLAVVAGVIVLVAAVGVIFRVRVPAGTPAASRTAGGRLPKPFWLAWVSLLATGSVELCLNLWVADVLRTHAQVSRAGATAAVSAIMVGMFVGRLAGSRLVLHLPTTAVMFAALAVSGGGFAVFWFATVPWLALSGLVVVGLGNALHYPLGMALAVEHSAGQPDRAVARTSYAVGLSFGVAPFLLAAVADRIGPHLAFLLVPVFLGVSAVAIGLLRRRVGPLDGAFAVTAPALNPSASSARSR